MPGLDAGLLELRLDSEIGVASRPTGHLVAADLARAERAETLLLRSLRRRPMDPRLHTAVGHLDLARQRPRHAERAYRMARGRLEGALLQPFAQNYVNILRQFGQDGMAARVQAETATLGVR